MYCDILLSIFFSSLFNLCVIRYSSFFIFIFYIYFLLISVIGLFIHKINISSENRLVSLWVLSVKTQNHLLMFFYKKYLFLIKNKPNCISVYFNNIDKQIQQLLNQSYKDLEKMILEKMIKPSNDVIKPSNEIKIDPIDFNKILDDIDKNEFEKILCELDKIK